MTFENLKFDRVDAVAVITFNRPKVLNALNAHTLTELSAAIAACKDDPGVRVVVLTGEGERAFVAGADINELAVQTPVQGKQTAARGQQILDGIEQLGKPVIPINVATIWHALRAQGINDKFHGRGWLLERF